MVELLTDYTTQIYHALSTDTRPDADPGAQLREIDTGKRFIFDGTSWNELSEGGGGGGIDETWNYIDTFTIQENVRAFSIDVSDSPYNQFMIECDATGTGADYLYIGTTLSDHVIYLSGNTFKHNVIIYHTFIGEFGGITNDHALFGWIVDLSAGGPGFNRLVMDSLDTIMLYAYRSNGVLNAGSTFKLYGRKAP